jgi:protein O-GlcNAc transferase
VRALAYHPSKLVSPHTGESSNFEIWELSSDGYFRWIRCSLLVPPNLTPHFIAAIQITPAFSTPHYDLGQRLQLENRLDEAKRQYELTFAYSSDQTELARAHNNLGAMLIQLKQPVEAVSQFDAALRIDPNEQNSLIGRGTVEYQKGSLDAALRDFVRAAQISASPIAWFWMGRTLEDQERFSEAAAAYQTALQMAPDMQEAQTRLNVVRLKIH